MLKLRMNLNSSTPTVLPLSGYSLVCFESRQADILRQVLEKNGAHVLSAPSVQEIPYEQNPEAFDFAEKLLAGKIDMVIFMTGVGTRYLMQVLEKKFNTSELLEALRKITLVARGPKSVQALREMGLVSAVTVPEPNTWHEILNELDENPRGIELEHRMVAVQEYGEANTVFVEALKKRGSRVAQIPVYRWALPQDRKPLEEAICQMIAGKVHAAVWTSAIQIKHALKVASVRRLKK